MMFLLLLLLGAQAGGAVEVPRDEAHVVLPADFPSVGSYNPNSDLLRRCTSKQVYDVISCDSYIDGVVQAAGMVAARFPKGPVAVEPSADPLKDRVQRRQWVADYLSALPNTKMSDPAAPSVYAALVAKLPYKGFHMQQLPLGVAEKSDK